MLTQFLAQSVMKEAVLFSHPKGKPLTDLLEEFFRMVPIGVTGIDAEVDKFPDS